MLGSMSSTELALSLPGSPVTPRPVATKRPRSRSMLDKLFERKVSAKSTLIEVGPNFWNIRGKCKHNSIPFLDIGTQVSIIKLPNGKFIILDTMSTSNGVKRDIDALTNNGKDIEAVICTHPFHCTYVQEFHDAYPDCDWYGTPRQLRKFPGIQWAGCLDDCRVQGKWLPDLELRVVKGVEFHKPLPEKTNHLASVFVFHPLSRTIHEDDTILIGDKDASFLIKGAGYKHGRFRFHECLPTHGLLPTAEGPHQFAEFLQQVINDWDFDNICAAHFGNKIGGAKEELQRTLLAHMPLFEEISQRNKKSLDNGSNIRNGKHIFNLDYDESNDNCECG